MEGTQKERDMVAGNTAGADSYSVGASVVKYIIIIVTHDGAEEMDHSVLCSTLTWGSRRGFLRAWRESTSERSLGRKEKRKGRRGTRDLYVK